MQKIKIEYMYSQEMTIMDPMDIRFNLIRDIPEIVVPIRIYMIEVC
jgi:hypothetical protein